jgi:predicted DNA-binding ArsR family transcriptional regulator
VAMMDKDEFNDLEKKIITAVGAEGKFSGDVAEKLGITQTMLKSLVKRSIKLDFRGHRIERIKE